MKNTGTVKHRRGFTLTEIAIVLGIAGLVLGGIWIAAANVYVQQRATSALRNIIAFQNSTRTLLHNEQSVSAAVNGVAATGLTDSCGSPSPCASVFFRDAGAFPADFINPGATADGAAIGLPGVNLFVTSQGYPVWTGVFDCDLYFQQSGAAAGLSGPPPCSGATVVELDLYQIPQPVCVFLLNAIINAHVDGLIDISTPAGGWGPITGPFYGTPNLLTSIPLSTATAACTPTASAFSYVTGTQSSLWMIFSMK